MCFIFIFLLFIQRSCSQCSSINFGGYTSINVTITEYDSPCTIQKDLIISAKTELILKPGVVLKFLPGVMLAVNGTLTAKGIPEKRIMLTKASTDEFNPIWPSEIRLVDEYSVSLGRLQIKYKNKWRGVCANNLNWTKIDTNFACQQLGFKNGTFSFGMYTTNISSYMLFENPSCNGSEQTILQCLGSSKIKIGSNACVRQKSVYLNCSGISSSTLKDYWWGLEFYNTSIFQKLKDQSSTNESTSTLQNIDIMYAGVNKQYESVPMLRADPYVPQLINVSIWHSAHDAVNYTNVISSTLISGTRIINSRGHGINIETILGRVTILNSMFTGNYGTGVKVKFLDRRFYVVDKLFTFCNMPTPMIQKFPQIITSIPLDFGSSCGRRFETQFGTRITMNVLEMDIEPEAWGSIEVFDGRSEGSNMIASYNLVNGSFPMGITSTLNYMFVKFNWKRPAMNRCPTLIDCIKFTIIVDSAIDSAPELYINNTIINNNTLYGTFLENIRNYVIINASNIMSNGYGAGIRIFGGAGDVLINSSLIEHNQGSGVNITYDGGWRIFNHSSFSYNLGPGINITFNQTSVDNYTRYTRIQQTHVMRSWFLSNQGYGIQVGNYCRAGHVIVNESKFELNTGPAVRMFSCFNIVPNTNLTNFTIAYNIFNGNSYYAIIISPLVNAIGRISNNTFYNHPHRVICLDNTDDFLHNLYFQNMITNYEVWGNIFQNNRGYYVAFFRLTEESPRQKMTVRYNIFIDNVIDAYNWTLNERARSYAVIVISSSNVNISRNHLENPNSKYEVATQLTQMDISLPVIYQWWSTTDYRYIISRIFDQYQRFNLARINYHPALASAWLMTPVFTDRTDPLEIDFQRNNYLGGRLSLDKRLSKGKYIADRDINILYGGRLYIEAGTEIYFENAIAMSVEGYVEAVGNSNLPISFILNKTDTWINSTLIRLADGPSIYEGRLELRATELDQWGTLCSEGWSVWNSNIVCNMIGLIADPDQNIDKPLPGSDNLTIIGSNVACDRMDMNIFDCPSDGMDHSCTHEQDIHIRCVDASWAGIKFSATSVPSLLKYVQISGAGLKDPSFIQPSPALKIDYNQHTLEYITIRDNFGDGLQIMHNDVYSYPRIVHSLIENNKGNGISIRSSFFEIFNTTIKNNKRSGFDYNPSLSSREALEIRSGVTNPNLTIIFDKNMTVQIGRENVRWIVTREIDVIEPTMFQLMIRTDSFFKIVLDVIDYNPLLNFEKVEIFEADSSLIYSSTTAWRIEEDLVDFPIVTQLSVVTIRWTVTNTSSGRLTFTARSKYWDWKWPFASIVIQNSTFKGNNRGLMLRNYNEPSNEFTDIYIRYRWEYVTIQNVYILNSVLQSMLVQSLNRYNMLYVPNYHVLEKALRFSEIEYNLIDNLFFENGMGIESEQLSKFYSNNALIWRISGNTLNANNFGGISLWLPSINLINSYLFNHSILINSSNFINNKNFQLVINGFYCNASIVNNIFENNICKLGCFDIKGTEKDFEMVDNIFKMNTARYIVEINIKSHTAYTLWVDARVFNNFWKDNKGIASLSPMIHPTYTFGVHGLQNVTINRNIFDNKLMDYELLAGQSSVMLENYLDATENFWATNDQTKIIQRIFDFDDWNSYSIAEYFPFLTAAYFGAPLFVGQKLRSVFDLTKPLGGRISQNVVLKKRTQPYVIISDLTIMPDYSLIIEPGVEIHLYPNVGFLVLGSFSAIGEANNRIQFKPMSGNFNSSGTPKNIIMSKSLINENINNKSGFQIRLTGGPNKAEGFIEIYNATEKRWSIICDDTFNEETGEVFCRTMGLESSNPSLYRSPYYDIFVLGYPIMHEQLIEWFWRDNFICDGSEDNLGQCTKQINYYLPQCMITRRYVYLRCGPRNIGSDMEYWGSIRFNIPAYESSKMTSGFSTLQYVNLYGAGRLHGTRSAAIESIFRTPLMSNVYIQNCLAQGVDYISPINEFTYENSIIENVNGYSIGIFSLNGQSTQLKSEFVPLVENKVPYNAYGFIRLCTVEKLLKISDRALIYFKYNFGAVDCITIVRSKTPRKQIGFRILQVNLYNDTIFENAIELYNSEFISDSLLLARINSNSSLDELKTFYVSSIGYDTMTVRIKASPAFREYGFVAELVSVPISTIWRPDFGANNIQLIRGMLFSGNEGGGLFYQNVGENNMRFSFEQSSILYCGLPILNNTMPGVINMFVQNTRLITIANNYIAYNAGGININTTTRDNQAALYANITNNVIIYNTNCEPLHVEGHHFQAFDIRYNYIAYNNVSFRNIFAAFGVQLNFTFNIVYNNTAQCILNGSVSELLSISQLYSYNAIYNNWANSFNRSTFFFRSSKFKLFMNYLINPYNIYEISMFNRTWKETPFEIYPSLDARNNWWGRNQEAYIEGRIWDRRDDDNLIKVDYSSFIQENTTILEGRCYPGWKLYDNKCYWYFGAAVTYVQATKFCKSMGSHLAWARSQTGRETTLADIVFKFQFNYDMLWKTWIFSDRKDNGLQCTVLQDSYVVNYRCNALLPFLCEKDPYVTVKMDMVPIIIAGAITIFVLLFIIFPLSIFSMIKSGQRKKDKLERKLILNNTMEGLSLSKNSRTSSYDTTNLQNSSVAKLNDSVSIQPIKENPYKFNFTNYGFDSDFDSSNAQYRNKPTSLDVKNDGYSSDLSGYGLVKIVSPTVSIYSKSNSITPNTPYNSEGIQIKTNNKQKLPRPMLSSSYI